MKTRLVLVALALATGTAAADLPTPEPVGGMPATDPPPQPDPQPPIQAPKPPQPDGGGGGGGGAVNDGGGDAGKRPNGFAIGLGFGYQLPASIQMPNRVSARFRLRNKMTFEPSFVLGNQSQKMASGGTDSKDSTTELTVGMLGRFPLVERGRVDLELLGGLGFGTTKDNPDGADNNTTTSTLGLSWGVGIGYWIGPHWQISFSATNPLISYTKLTRQMPAPLAETTTTTTAVGIEWAPVLNFMLHLYH